MLLIIIEGIHCVRLFRQYKREQQSEIDAERKKLEEERSEAKRLLTELEKMKNELEQQGSGGNEK